MAEPNSEPNDFWQETSLANYALLPKMLRRDRGKGLSHTFKEPEVLDWLDLLKNLPVKPMVSHVKPLIPLIPLSRPASRPAAEEIPTPQLNFCPRFIVTCWMIEGFQASDEISIKTKPENPRKKQQEGIN